MFKVQNLKDDIYQVLEYPDEDAELEEYSNVFQGSLSDCEAFIRLSEGNYL